MVNLILLYTVNTGAIIRQVMLLLHRVAPMSDFSPVVSYPLLASS